MITDKQREKRRDHIGSSDMAAILGLDPQWGNACDLLLEKAGKLTPNGETSEPAQFGTDIEDSLLRWFARESRLQERGLALLRNQRLVAEPFACHLDAGIVATGKRSRSDITEIAEAKWTSLTDEWGEEMTDQVPERVLIQTHVQMYCVGDHCKVAWVPVMMPGYRLPERRKYRVERIDKLMQVIVTAGENFWRSVEHYRETGEVDLPNFAPSLAVLKRWKREPKSVVSFTSEHTYVEDGCVYCGAPVSAADGSADSPEEISTICPKAPASLITQWEAAKARKLGAESDVDSLLAAILTHLRQAEAAALPDGREFRYLEEGAAPKCDRPGLQTEHPEIYKQFFTPVTRRVPRVVTPKVKTKGASL